MAIQQVLTVYINLKGDAAASTFSFALQNLYQFSNGIAVPFGGAGVVPTAVSANNPPVPVTSVTVDANGNITLTTTSPLPASVFTFQLDLTFTSGASSSTSPTQSTNVTSQGAVTTSAPVYVTGTTSPLSLDTSGNLRVVGSFAAGALPDVIGTTSPLGALNNTATVAAAGYASVGMFLATGTLVGTITAQVSFDGGTTWVNTLFDDPSTGNKTQTIVFGSANPATSRSIVGAAGASHYQVIVTAYTSGTANATLRATGVIDPSTIHSGSVAATIQPVTISQEGGWVTTSAPSYSNATLNALSLDTSGNLRTRNAGSSATGSAVPADASYMGFNSGGNLTGVSSAAPLPTTLSGNVTTFSLTVGQTAVVNMLNLVNAAVVVTGTWTGTLIPEVSIDNGVTWNAVDVWDEVTESYINTASGITANGSYWFEPIGAIWFARVRAATVASGGPITGTIIGTIAPNLNLEYTGIAGSPLPNNLVAVGGNDPSGNIQPTQLVAKGVQPTAASSYSPVLQPKDAGRTYVTLYAQLITGVTTEALATFTKNVGGTATTAQTAYTITNGKTFRIQALSVEIANSTTVANNAIYNVRAAASVAASSPIVVSCAASAPVAVATSKGFANLSIPDGVELLGNGTLQIGVSHLENVTTASVSSFTLTGYEY